MEIQQQTNKQSKRRGNGDLAGGAAGGGNGDLAGGAAGGGNGDLAGGAAGGGNGDHHLSLSVLLLLVLMVIPL